MEEPVQPRSLKLTIKMKSNNNINNSSAAKPPNNVDGELNTSVTRSPCSPRDSSQDQEKARSPETTENKRTENEDNHSPDNSQYQLVLYDAPVNGGQEESDPDHIDSHNPSLSLTHPFSNHAPKLFPNVGAFTVQCVNCFKWRLIPTEQKYEEIREHIIEQPFSCETAREWRPYISCDDPPDIVQDGSRLWAIDKPGIAQPPRGWQRLLRIRAEGGSKFADVYYVSPSGKRLRSMVETQRYLNEHEEYAGISLSQFSFQIPRPLQENYCRKRPARALTDDANHNGLLRPAQVEPLAWASPNMDTDLQLTGMELFKPEVQPAKKKRPSSSSKKKQNGEISYEQNAVSLDDID